MGVLGSGSFGVVIRAEDQRTNPPIDTAIKLMPRGGFVSRRQYACLPALSGGVRLAHASDAPSPLPSHPQVRSYKTYLKREIVHTASLRHPLVIPLREVFLTTSHLGIAMEFCAGGDLHKYLEAQPGCRLPEDEARWLFQQLAVGLQYCHRRGVANRDLKLENLLLDTADQARPLLKICDFGYSKVRCAVERATFTNSHTKYSIDAPG